MIDVMEFFGIFWYLFVSYFIRIFFPLAMYRKSWMRSAVSGSSTHDVIKRHGVRSFYWPM
jgi:hypothetical protein